MISNWNPWHGCIKLSSGCKFCYVYRQDAMYGSEVASSKVRQTDGFDLPVRLGRDKKYKIPSGTLLYTCFTSDFFVEEADDWRGEAWQMIRRRPDVAFFIFTKRIDRFCVSLPSDWGDGYDNVIIGCTVENQDRADYRLPIFKKLPIKHKAIICAPLLEQIELEEYLDESIEQLAASGESGREARICDYDWVLDLRRQCIARNVPFLFHQTGANLRKDGHIYKIRRSMQIAQARKAGIDTLSDIDYTGFLKTLPETQPRLDF